MAIDDNASYELTGYQVKDLAGRIRRKADASAIPTVNDATLTLVQNGTTVGTFTANQSTDTTVNLAGGIYADDPTAPANPNAWIAGSDIDWTTLSENQSDIRKIHYDTFTATTDSNGFANVPTNLITPSTGMILAAATTTQQCFTTPFNDKTQSRYTIKTEQWDRTSIGNTSVTYRITYILY